MDIRDRNILIIGEDHENDISLQLVLADQYKIYNATNSLTVIDRIKEVNPELILVNAVVSDIDRWDLVTTLKTSADFNHIPIIVNMGIHEVEMRKDHVLDLDLVDFILWPIQSEVVKLRVRNLLELKQFRDSRSDLATTDLLTGVANRQYLEEWLASEWRRAIRHQAPQSFIIADIDFFGRFNEIYGCLAGDACLKKISAAIVKCAKREIDYTARFGADEFACLLAETDINGAVQVAGAILDTVEELNIPHAGSLAADHVTLSIGVATLTPSSRLLPQKLINLAEIKLAEAKRNGYNQVCN
jgi:diguanylate cyclase (GGDEF)-like protein